MFTRLSRLRSRSAQRSKHARRTLQVETLEHRCLLAGLVFDSVILANSDTAGAYSYATAADAAGNTYMSGMFSGVMDFDRISSHPGNPDILTARGNYDGFVAKYGPSGQFLWAQRMGGESTDGSYDQVQGMAVDSSGNVYLGGQFVQNADFGAVTLNSAGKTDAFVAKLDGNGNFLWANGWGTDVGEYVTDLVADSNGNVTAVGYSLTLPLGTREIHIRQFASNGNSTWIGQFSTGGSATALSVTRDLDGNLYVGGNFKGTVDLDPGSDVLLVTGSSTTNNGFVMKLTGSGELQWAAPLVADTSQNANSSINNTALAISDDGSVAFIGNYQGQVDIDPTSGVFLLPNAQANVSYFAKLSPSGQLVTATAYSDDFVLGELVAFPGGFHGLITFSGSFNPTPGISLSTPSGWDIAIVELTGNGVPVWAFQLGATGNNIGANIVSDGTGGFLATGWIGSGTTVDYDPDPYRTHTVSNPAGADAFVLKLKPRGDTKFYVVNDASTNRTYEYDASGNTVEDYSLNSGNSTPRGAASTIAGDRTWVVDANRKVYVYDTSGGLLGSWTAGTLPSNATVEGITTNGTDVWIVDAKGDKVYKYAGAATRLSGSQNAASNFSLNSSNNSPKDIVTDGASLWVVNDSTTDKVFKYTVAGSLLGSWTISSANSKPTGLTIDPANVSNIWIVDSGTKLVYQYTAAASRTSGSQSAAATFALAASNTNPQGIADPPPSSLPSSDQNLVIGMPLTDAIFAAGFLNATPPSASATVNPWTSDDRSASELATDILRGPVHAEYARPKHEDTVPFRHEANAADRVFDDFTEDDVLDDDLFSELASAFSIPQ